MRRRDAYELRHAESERVRNMKMDRATPEPQGIFSTVEDNKHKCPKCGREFKRGLHLHVKHCHVPELR